MQSQILRVVATAAAAIALTAGPDGRLDVEPLTRLTYRQSYGKAFSDPPRRRTARPPECKGENTGLFDFFRCRPNRAMSTWDGFIFIS